MTDNETMPDEIWVRQAISGYSFAASKDKVKGGFKYTRADRQAPQVDVLITALRNISTMALQTEQGLKDERDNNQPFGKLSVDQACRILTAMRGRAIIALQSQGHLSPKQAPQVDAEGLKKFIDPKKSAVEQIKNIIWNECIECLAAQGHLSPKQDEWQPVVGYKTAPEFEDIACLVTDGSRVGVAVQLEDGVYIHEYPDNYNLYTIEPTHWMPLPTPPKTGEDDE